MLLTIDSIPTGGSRRRGDKRDALVIPDGLDIDAGQRGKPADEQRLPLNLVFMGVDLRPCVCSNYRLYMRSCGFDRFASTIAKEMKMVIKFMIAIPVLLALGASAYAVCTLCQ